MLKVAVCTVLVLSITAIDIKASVWTSHDQKMFAQIKQSGWGNFILNFGELHLSTGGILAELNTEIAKLIDELDEELAEVHHQYARRTEIHNREIARLEQEIQDKEREVFNAHDFYDNVLIPQRDRFAAQLEQLQENISQNRRTLNEATVQRANDHADFEAKVSEHNEAISAIDESLGLLSQLQQYQQRFYYSISIYILFLSFILMIQEKIQEEHQFPLRANFLPAYPVNGWLIFQRLFKTFYDALKDLCEFKHPMYKIVELERSQGYTSHSQRYLSKMGLIT